jgi:hypothetical protein
LRNFTIDTKSELDQLLSSSTPQSSSYKEAKPHFRTFDNPLFLEPSSHFNSEKKPLISSVENRKPTAIVTNMVVNRMDAIVAEIYAPLILPQVLYAFPSNDYMKYLPRFNGEVEVYAEENLNYFYNFADNFNVEHADVWMRLFVQSLD